MAVSGDYPTPIHVNGFICKNCSDVDLAKKHIDPEHPKSGPYNVDAAADPSRKTAVVVFGGALSGLSKSGDASSAAQASSGQSAASPSSITAFAAPTASGQLLDIRV